MRTVVAEAKFIGYLNLGGEIRSLLDIHAI